MANTDQASTQQEAAAFRSAVEAEPIKCGLPAINEARWIKADLRNANKRNTDAWRERDLAAAWDKEIAELRVRGLL